MTEIYVAHSSFATQVDGVTVIVRRGNTVREGHPLLEKHAPLFWPIKATFEYTPPQKPTVAPPKLPTPTPTKAPTPTPAPAPKLTTPVARVTPKAVAAEAKADDKKG